MSMKIVIIGAVATGPKAACRLKRLRPEAHVVMVDRDSLISYGGCGIPYYVSGDVADAAQLQSTSFHMVRDDKFFRQAKGVTVLTRTEALALDRFRKEVLVRNLESGQEQSLPYDRLVLATGSRPNRLPVPGADLEGVFTVGNLGDAVRIKELIAAGRVERPVVIGGGAIGLEMVESMADLWGLDVTLIEVREQLLPGLVSPILARVVQNHLAERGVTQIYLDEKVQRLEGAGRVQRVVTDRRTIETDLVIMAVGVKPNADLARAAGLDISPSGAIVVNDRFQTADPDIYAGGDCVDNMSLITGRRVYFPSGSLANKHGRVIGTNLAGAVEEFEGVVGSFILKTFDLAVATAGLSLARAQAEGFEAFSTTILQSDRAHFYPGQELMTLELVVETPTGRVLGIQGTSPNGDALAARIDAVAALLKYRALVRDVGNLEMAYAPPYASAMDVVNSLGNTAENVLAGKNRVVDVDELTDRLASGRTDFVCLDVRGPANAAPFLARYPGVWVNVPQEQLLERLDEIPRGKELILVCNSGARSYEAQIALDHLNIGPSRNLQGGIGLLKKWGQPLE